MVELSSLGRGAMANLSRGKPTAGEFGEALYYSASGLDYVYLANGYRIENTPYGRGVSIEEIQSLHQAIATHIVLRRGKMDAGAFRFLRHEMRLTQEQLAEFFGVNVQTIARYEKGQTDIPGPADRLARILYVMRMVGRDERLLWLDQISRALRSPPPAEGAAIFQLTTDGWAESD